MEIHPHIKTYPHCDARILHKRGDCKYCDRYPDLQEIREIWGIAFTGHKPTETEYSKQLPCPADFNRPAGSKSDHRHWGGNRSAPPGEKSVGHDSFGYEVYPKDILPGDKHIPISRYEKFLDWLAKWI
jgi:hypothetical protein